TTIGGITVGGAGGLDIFVAKLHGSDGSVVWATSLGSSADDSATGIAIGSTGQIVVSGQIGGPIEAGGPFSGASDALIVSYSNAGTRLWAKILGTSGADIALGVTAGVNAFYAVVDLGANIGTSIAGV